MDITDKDIYENIINYANDRTILNMILIRPDLTDPIFFERLIDRKFPLSKIVKRDNESWRQFFLRMIYYIAKLEEEFGIPYISSKGYNPEYLYRRWKDTKNIYNVAMEKAAAGGDLKNVELMAEKGATSFQDAWQIAAERGHLEIIKYLEEKVIERRQTVDLNKAVNESAYKGHLKTVEYLIKKAREINHRVGLNKALRSAAIGDHLDVIKVIIKQAKKWGKRLDFNKAIDTAIFSGHPEIAEYLKQFV